MSAVVSCAGGQSQAGAAQRRPAVVRVPARLASRAAEAEGAAWGAPVSAPEPSSPMDPSGRPTLFINLAVSQDQSHNIVASGQALQPRILHMSAGLR